MKYANLGRTGLKVSKICLGTMNFGVYTNEKDSCEIMDKSLELGINFFDTANVYGKIDGEGPGIGETESIIGRWLSKNKNNREKIVLATKVYVKMGEGPNNLGLSAYNIRKACEDSLRRLQTDHIDLYQMHHIDRNTPWEEIWQAMEKLVREGKIIYTGSSNFAAWNITQAQCFASSRHFMGLVSEQSLYNLCDRMIELEVIPTCREYGIGIIPWSPLKFGLLSGILQKKDKQRSSSSHEHIQKLVEKYRS
ncbi:MAG: aldo/keto reductase, partial [Actinobacteria bacterium]|nr:aldo/keto reductase [Actinomycetota bacterium]